MNYVEKVKKIATAIYPDLVEIRHHLHQYPELSFEEYKTSQYIQSKLEAWGISYENNIAGTGVLAKVASKASTKIKYLRADMDALPIHEANNVPYASKNEGLMHACGHDVHTSCALGAAFILHQMRDELPHNVYIIFQPGEEKLPGGASMIIEEGLFQKYSGESILGQHVFPSLEVGKVGVKSGMYMASADEIYIELIGKGGHAAMPHDNIDTVLMAAEVITALQKVVSRYASPIIPSVLSFGKINSIGGATNIIPDTVKIEGTFRTFNEKWRSEAHTLISQIVTSTVSSMGGKCKVNIIKGYPYLENEPRLTARVTQGMISFLGSENVVELPTRMTSEDFSFYTHHLPGCFYRLGTANIAKGINSSVHTPTFDIDESALEIGAGLMAYLAIVT